MLIIYTGQGKGKTSAATGQAIRALGQGLVVVFGQFLKRDGQAGEQKILGNLLGQNFWASGIGFFRQETERKKHQKKVLELLQWAEQKVDSGIDMLILDEAIYVLNMNLLQRQDIENLITHCREHDVHLVLTGRGAPEWLIEQADLVSEIREVKHPYRTGIKAQKGIEF
ncbi:cob(I)yrinic acid a,c-diamide adenosyltransferase [Desulfohalobiaceae bacterium Ax17]|jgi:cob(I)alamin adenosyltransferase|uniref:cob(I)yrinic acid a,c-diamide adenosyltransferase n=1 Tax=Desulfovulcanus ferrireducens TaxID=2831190 RepID=UPI00207BA701|nr:cob(I)yrinic acid a,c-diamide adenosyltransferase [Desulfovulcanus ferrireducens]MBT8762672.1 cob(I)yrinic acid a,c-diamide adenosyltransferase [Desulfovulcanus ferrireducens]